MKTVTSQMQTDLEQELTSLATLWRVTRTDGQEFFFTDHNEDISFEGNTYESSVGYNKSSVDTKAGMAVDNLDLLGFLDNDALTEEDLRAGKFDFAEIRIGIVNWKNLASGMIKMKRGKLGEVTYSEVTGTFKAELRGLTQLFSQNALELYQAECRADLGDSRCKVALFPSVMLPNTSYALSTKLRGSTLLDGIVNRRLLTHLDTDASNVGSAGGTGTLGSEAEIQTSQKVFGAGSVEFTPTAAVDPSQSYVEFNDSDLYTIGSNQFTIECWVRFKSLTETIQTIMSQYNSDSDQRSWYLRRNGGDLEFFYSDDGTTSAPAATVSGAFSWAINTDYHIAVTRDDQNDIRMFVNGTQVGVTTAAAVSIFNSTAPIRLGKLRSTGGGDSPLNGFIDEASITIGTALYTANFVPSASAFQVHSDVIPGLTPPDYGDLFFEVTTAGTTGDVYPTFDTTPGNTTTWGTAVFTTREAFAKAFTVATVTSNRVFTVTFPNGADSREVDDWFKYGAVIWQTGDNAGIAMEVKGFTASNDTVELFLSMPYGVQVGDTGTIYAGCDRKKQTCIDKFNNIVNYRGEPYVPGQDEYLSYPSV